MWEHFAQKWIFPNSHVLKQCRADMLEVYCSQNSQLTKQAQRQQMWAERHSFGDGDLTLPEGRKALYDSVLRLLPQRPGCHPSVKHGVGGMSSIAIRVPL